MREIRRQIDREFASKVLSPLRQRLGHPGMTALLDAYLCSPSQRKPILIYALSDEDRALSSKSASEPDLELELAACDFFFTLFPFHCRRKLSFSTQIGELHNGQRRGLGGAPQGVLEDRLDR